MKQSPKLLLLAILFWSIPVVHAQTNSIKAETDSLKYLGANAFDCNSVFWIIIAHKKEAIPYLIDKLGDSTITRAKHKCKLQNLRVGDLAYLALAHITFFPTAQITHMQFDVIVKGRQDGFFEYIEGKRLLFQTQVRNWYNKSGKSYKWTKLTSQQITDCD